MRTAVAGRYTKKHAQLMEIIHNQGAQALLLSTPASLAWFLDGARTHVSLAAPPILTVLVHARGCELATSISEAQRIQDEEVTGQNQLTIHVTKWYEPLDNISSWFPEASDWNILAEAQIDQELRALRSALSLAEVDRYRRLCQDTASVMTKVLAETSSDDSEYAVAAHLSAGAIALGGDVLVALVSGSTRVQYRHPLPTMAPLGRKAMAVLCVRRHGLIANLTRWVRYAPPTAQELAGEADILKVEAEIIRGIAHGKALGELLPAIEQAYPAHGFDEDEWTRHHQGGIAGYNGRDPRFSPESVDVFQPNQAFAFNPSAERDGLMFKVEDTMLLTDSGDIEVLSVDPQWPATIINGLPRPQVLQR
ncbi:MULTISPECIES: M24 family metallopeptidase [Micrococcaceae]|uniref:M24 family metallopeptidase n=1 Tax=Micrococcaceae TaxID=1268 RepID=UPI001A925B42|nr:MULTISPECIES: M24 family metallopeptidase [Micrococcaceae]UXN32371.1 M24 family metallopeptidase [Glutamicibacter sp. M10]